MYHTRLIGCYLMLSLQTPVDLLSKSPHRTYELIYKLDCKHYIKSNPAHSLNAKESYYITHAQRACEVCSKFTWGELAQKKGTLFSGRSWRRFTLHQAVSESSVYSSSSLGRCGTMSPLTWFCDQIALTDGHTARSIVQRLQGQVDGRVG